MNMSSPNLIKLGAYLQRLFDLPDEFKILFLPDDYKYQEYRVAVEYPERIRRGPSPITAMDWDQVQLQLIGTPDNFETVRAGYSRRARTLVLAGRAPAS